MKKTKRVMLLIIALVILTISSISINAVVNNIESLDSSLCPNCLTDTMEARCGHSYVNTTYQDCHEPGHGENCVLSIDYFQTIYVCTSCGYNETLGVHRHWYQHSGYGTPKVCCPYTH